MNHLILLEATGYDMDTFNESTGSIDVNNIVLNGGMSRRNEGVCVGTP
jgi:hypothetical protein